MDALLEMLLEVICHIFGTEEKIEQKPKVIRVLLYVLLFAIVILSALLVNFVVMLWRDPTKSQIPVFGLLGALLVTVVLFVLLLAKRNK